MIMPEGSFVFTMIIFIQVGRFTVIVENGVRAFLIFKSRPTMWWWRLIVFTESALAVSFSPRPGIDVFALPEKPNMAVTKSDPDPKIRKMSIT